MEKTLYIAVTIKDGGRYYAYVKQTRAANNLVSLLTIPGINSANVCDTRRQAREIVAHWNACYKANGIYMYDTPEF